MQKFHCIFLLCLFIVCVSYFSVCSVSTTIDVDQAAWEFGHIDLDTTWHQYIKRFKKSYNTSSLQKEKKRNFAFNKEVVKTHNKKAGIKYVMALNEFSDLSDDEFNKKMSLNKYYTRVAAHVPIDHTLHNSTIVYRKSFDWRDYNCVTPIRDYNALSCGAAWAFAAAEAVEGAWCLARDVLYNLSEQQIMDSTPHTDGCRGGNVGLAFRDIMHSGGICTEFQYPFEGKKGVCRKDQCKKVAEILYYARVPSNSEVAAENALLLRGPLAVHINADKWRHYRAGVFDEITFGPKLDHNALLIGYDSDTALQRNYWIIKNSWGTSWGEDGYIRVQRAGVAAGRSGVLSEMTYVVPKTPEF